ncbi:MAG: hypothetical protein R3240_00675 [Gammaproteobacteria bacterium]|nr:hypothetical protein [Gammaproteobacteria bacterium]
MFPDWITEDENGSYCIDADKAYPALLAELKEKKLPEATKSEPSWTKELRSLDLEKLTQYWIEVAYQMAKLELRRYLLLAGKNPWPPKIRIKTGYKTLESGDLISHWHMSNFPKGAGIAKATQGKEAREHYRTLRGFIPN